MTARSAAWSMLVAPLRPTALRNCPASGWELHRSCAAGDGTVVCPSCSQRVATEQDSRLGARVRVIKGHSA
jgi:hypothetical protein